MSQQKTSNLKKENKINTWKNKSQIWKDRIRTHVTRCCCKTSAFVERDGKDVWYWLHQCAMIASILRWEQNILNTYAAKVGFRILRCHRHIECERNLMAQRPAPLNMNKPSSAETQAKPNSARRHHSRTEQEALELLLASTTELHSPAPSLPKNSRSWSQLPIKRKIMA